MLFLDLVVLNFRKELAAEGQVLTKQNLSDQVQRKNLEWFHQLTLLKLKLSY